MWKKGILAIACLLAIVLTGCDSGVLGEPTPEKKQETMPENMPENFDFTVYYGINGNNLVDTFHNIVVKDLIEDGEVEAKVELTNDEMTSIYEKMKDINIYSDLDVTDDSGCKMEPSRLTSWEIAINDKLTNIRFEEHCSNEPKDVAKMRELEAYVHGLVSAKESYKSLPQARGSYE